MLLKTNVEKMSVSVSEKMLLKTRYLQFSSEYVDENRGETCWTAGSEASGETHERQAERSRAAGAWK
jgi:hypothetical protein